jgi:hypothetical protein
VHLAKRIIIGAAVAAAATGLMSGAASASTSLSPWYPTPPGTAVTHVYNDDTVPGYGGNWASDWITRTASVSAGTPVAPANCGETSGPCYSYTAAVHDLGTFRAITGAATPNQVVPGRTILSAVKGIYTGSATFAFYATGAPNPKLVPKTYDDAPYLTDWPELFFPDGTTFVGVTGIPFTLNYSSWTQCGPQHWTESSSNDYGDLARDGNITGCRYYDHSWHL